MLHSQASGCARRLQRTGLKIFLSEPTDDCRYFLFRRLGGNRGAGDSEGRLPRHIILGLVGRLLVDLITLIRNAVVGRSSGRSCGGEDDGSVISGGRRWRCLQVLFETVLRQATALADDRRAQQERDEEQDVREGVHRHLPRILVRHVCLGQRALQLGVILTQQPVRVGAACSGPNCGRAG